MGFFTIRVSGSLIRSFLDVVEYSSCLSAQCLPILNHWRVLFCVSPSLFPQTVIKTYNEYFLAKSTDSLVKRLTWNVSCIDCFMKVRKLLPLGVSFGFPVLSFGRFWTLSRCCSIFSCLSGQCFPIVNHWRLASGPFSFKSL